MNGCELLSEFRERRSETAFAEMVRRYADLVFSVAKRRLNGDSLAEEVAQLVFVRLAKAPPKLSSEAALLGWLHRTSVHVAIDLWRADSRRRAREEKAVAMQMIEEGDVSQLPVEVDEALNELEEPDRQALLLRFFDGRKMRELGAELGISEDAAKMRVGRSLERLREKLAARGVQASAVALSGFLGEQAITAAPAALVKRIVTSAGIGAAASGGWFAGLSFKFLGAVAVGVAVVTLVAVKVGDYGKSAKSDSSQPMTVGVVSRYGPIAGGNAATAAENTELPDPRKLLEGVARARNRIFSGNIEFERIVEHESLDVPGVRVTNRVQQLVLFDGSKRRLEQIGLEYAYVGVGAAGEQSAQTMRDRKMTHAAAVQEGLLEEFEARYVSAFDGAAVLEYRERGGKSDGAVIANLGHGHLAGQFDPRCFGMRALSHTTVENGLVLDRAEKIELIGKETVDGESAWHIEVRWEHYVADHWVSVAQPERLLKHALLGDVFVSRYATDKPGDPLPIEVVENSRGGMLTRYKRLFSQYNIPVDPSFCTLAGLGMPRGTAVTDVRSKRGLGYWTGDGLSENPPPKGDSESTEMEGLSLRERISFLETEPESERGLESATWILLNTPDGDEVAKAGKAILEHHLQNTNLFLMAERLEQLRHRCQKDLLKGMLEKNPVAEIRCRACFSLAITFRDEADYGLKKKETAEARAYFQRVISDFSKAGKEGFDKAIKSEKAIKEIDTLWVGHAAPDFAAKTVSGASLKLSDYFGRIVVLFFRSGTGTDFEWHQKLYKKFAPLGVEFVEIVCEKEIKNSVEWPTIMDGRYGPISELFMIRTWTSTFIIGRDGKIRGRDLYWELEKGIEAAISK